MVASIGELGTSRVQIHFSSAATAAFSHVLSSLESTGAQIKDVLDESKKRYIPIIVLLGLSGLAMAGCSSAAMDPNQLRGLQGQLSVPGDMIPVGAQGGSFQIGYFVNGAQALLDQARNAGVPEADIQLFLAQTQAHVSASVDGVPVGLQCSSGGQLQTNCSLPIHTGRDGVSTVQVSAQTCKQPENICGAPAQAVFRVNSDTKGPTMQLQPELSPDGKSMQIVIKAFDQSPVLRSIDAAPCGDPSKKIQVGNNGKTMFASVVLLPGTNCFQVNAVDAMGNPGYAKVDVPYAFGINLTSAQLTPEGKIAVSGAVQNSLFPGLTVNLRHCNIASNVGSGLSQNPPLRPDNTFSANLAPLPGENTCLHAEATDPQGVKVGNDFGIDIQYPITTGPVVPIQDSKTGEWYLTGSEIPSYMNMDSVVIRGTQKLWKLRPFGVTGEFSCEKLPNGTRVNGQQFPFVAKCVGINKAGQAMVEFQMGDKENGYVSPVMTIPLDLPIDPPLRDAVVFYGAVMTAVFAAGAASGAITHFALNQIRRNRLETSVINLCSAGDFVTASTRISDAKVDDLFKQKMSEYATREEIYGVEGKLASVFVQDKGQAAPSLKQLAQAQGDIIRLLTHSQYTTETTKQIMIKYIACLRNDVAEKFRKVSSISDFRALEGAIRAGDKRLVAVIFDTLKYVIDLQCVEKNHVLWDAIQASAPTLAQNLRRISIFYLLSRGDRLFYGRNFRSLVVGPNEFEFVVEALWDAGRFDDFTKCEELAAVFSAEKQAETAIAKVRAKKTRNK